MLLHTGIKNCQYSIFYAVTKRTTNRQQTKNQLKVDRKRFRSRKAICWPSKKCLIAALSNTYKVLCNLSLMKLGNKQKKEKDKFK